MLSVRKKEERQAILLSGLWPLARRGLGRGIVKAVVMEESSRIERGRGEEKPCSLEMHSTGHLMSLL